MVGPLEMYRLVIFVSKACRSWQWRCGGRRCHPSGKLFFVGDGSSLITAPFCFIEQCVAGVLSPPLPSDATSPTLIPWRHIGSCGHQFEIQDFVSEFPLTRVVGDFSSQCWYARLGARQTHFIRDRVHGSASLPVPSVRCEN